MKYVKRLIILIIVLLVWQIISDISGIGKFIFPSPTDIYESIIIHYNQIIRDTVIFMFEAICGLLVGIILGSGLALLSYWMVLRKVISPIIITLQSIPRIIIAPFVILWIGFGMTSKIFFSSFICFLPIYINTLEGLLQIDNDLLDVIKTYKPSRFKEFIKIRLPNAFQNLLIGLKSAVPLTFAGVVVGEWFIGGDGLGFLAMSAAMSFDAPLSFAAIIPMSLLSIGFYKIVVKIQTKFKEKYL